MGALTHFKLTLDAIDPRLFSALLALGAFLFVYGWRKLLPTSFDKLPAGLQSIPATAFAMAVSGMAASDVKHMVIDALFAAIMGQSACGMHHSLKAAAILGYTGGDPPSPGGSSGRTGGGATTESSV